MLGMPEYLGQIPNIQANHDCAPPPVHLVIVPKYTVMRGLFVFQGKPLTADSATFQKKPKNNP